MARLTIGIPTQGKRPDLLERAIASALSQSTPAAVLVSDSDGAARDVVNRFSGRGVRYHKSNATCLWENWTECVHNCSTELFAWLQDDDVVAPHFAGRVCQGMDALPGSFLWMGRLGVSLVAGLANWWMATGPMVPMDLIHGTGVEICPDVVVAGSYFTAFALSPAVAFRCNTASCDAVAGLPKDCDLYVERLVLAELAKLGRVYCDPAISGLWCIHEGNESRKQIDAGGVHPQYPTLARRLDALIDGDAWGGPFAGWVLMQNPETLGHWANETRRYAGITPTFDRAHEVLTAYLPKPQRPVVETAEDMGPKRAERAVRKRA